MKWADYLVSKFSWVDEVEGGWIEKCLVHEDHDTWAGAGQERRRAWVVEKLRQGFTFAVVDRSADLYRNPEPLTLLDDGRIQFMRRLPVLAPATKVFVSFYHKDDEGARKSFDDLTDDLFTNKSVGDGDIDAGLSDEYIKQLIQKGYLQDTTVLVVLVGPNTLHRKHIDWEIAGALDYRVGDRYAGLLGLLLPAHPDFGEGKKVTYDKLPRRLAANVRSGYAVIADWTTDRRVLQRLVQAAFERRSDEEKIENRSVARMEDDTGP